MKHKRWLLAITLAGLAVRLALWEYFRAHTLQLVIYRLPDDALYYFRMAQNLANGLGVSFDGIHPSNGMHPLWLFCIVPIFSIGLSNWGAIHAVLLFQSFLDTAIIWTIGSTVYDLLPNAQESNRKSAAMASAIMYAFGSIVLLRGINGLETTLAALFSVVWFRTFVRTERNNDATQWILLGIVTGLLLLSRTDSVLLILPATVFLAITRFRENWKRMALALLMAVIIVAPWIVWNYVQFGTIIQSSAEAVPMLAMRKYDVIYGSSKYFHLVSDSLHNSLKPFWLSTFALSFITILFRIVRGRKHLSDSEKGIYLLVGGGILLLTVHSLFRGFIRDWYVAELIPIFLLAFGVSIGRIAGTTEARMSGRWILAAAILLLQGLLYHSPQYTSQSTVLQTGIPEVNELTGTHKLASFNSGYYGYFSNNPTHIVNIDGVVNSDALNALKNGDIHGYLARDSVSYILDFQGDFGGYLNLFDHRMLDGFIRDSSFGTLKGGNDSLVLYRRK